MDRDYSRNAAFYDDEVRPADRVRRERLIDSPIYGRNYDRNYGMLDDDEQLRLAIEASLADTNPNFRVWDQIPEAQESKMEAQESKMEAQESKMEARQLEIADGDTADDFLRTVRNAPKFRVATPEGKSTGSPMIPDYKELIKKADKFIDPSEYYLNPPPDFFEKVMRMRPEQQEQIITELTALQEEIKNEHERRRLELLAAEEARLEEIRKREQLKLGAENAIDYQESYKELRAYLARLQHTSEQYKQSYLIFEKLGNDPVIALTKKHNYDFFMRTLDDIIDMCNKKENKLRQALIKNPQNVSLTSEIKSVLNLKFGAESIKKKTIYKPAEFAKYLGIVVGANFGSFTVANIAGSFNKAKDDITKEIYNLEITFSFEDQNVDIEGFRQQLLMIQNNKTVTLGRQNYIASFKNTIIVNSAGYPTSDTKEPLVVYANRPGVKNTVTFYFTGIFQPEMRTRTIR